MAIIYGVDSEKKVTPLMVRDAMLECFYQAHCEDSSISGDEKVNKDYCVQLVKKAFDDAEANFEKPTKQDIMKAIGKLQEFSKNFRDPEIIEKHATEIMKLVEKL
ncbi:hypothetical protein KKA15_01355 [Patescibacteria group bacterium]|nr:hypothetical protein [Patescibacteria group bacterium]